MKEQVAIMNQARLQKRKDRDIFFRNLAVELYEKHKNEPLFISGIVLYWAEGTRLKKNYRKYQLAFTNSDSSLIRFYCNFLEKYFKFIDRKAWRAELFLYPDIKLEQAISFWSETLGIPSMQFIKSQILKSRSKQRKLTFGTCCVYVNSKDACIIMQTWIDCCSFDAAVIQR